MKRLNLLAPLMLAALLMAACGPATLQPQAGDKPPVIETGPAVPPPIDEAPTDANTAAIDPLFLKQAMRKLWEDHITWTRVYIIDVAADLPEASVTAERLLENQVQIGDAIKPFYGAEAGEQLTALLTDHILIAVDLLAAAKSGDTAAFDEANTRWYANADEIAAFLSSANPDNWPQAEMQAMMKSHLDLTLEEATARLSGDWQADVAAYDKVHEEILEMADMLADGIVKQFPDQFAEQVSSPEEAELTLTMDKLWEDHVTWTRVYIISVTSNLEDADAAATRLLQNQTDIGDAIKPVYGEEAGTQLTTLLQEHIQGAVDILAAAKAGDTAAMETASASWYANADEIAAFLNSANPDFWPLEEMQAMMKSHLDLTLQEATARLNADWEADVAAYDEVHLQILDMAAMLVDGITSQFPDLF